MESEQGRNMSRPELWGNHRGTSWTLRWRKADTDRASGEAAAGEIQEGDGKGSLHGDGGVGGQCSQMRTRR